MKRMNLTAAVLLAAFAAPTLAEDEPNPVAEADPIAQVNAEAEKPAKITIKANRIVAGQNNNRVVIESEDGGRVIVLQKGEGPKHELNASVITIDMPLFEGDGRIAFEGDGRITKPAPAQMQRAAFLGVNAKPLDIDTAKELGLKRSTGLLINYVADGGPASDAGLKKGDVLTKLNDQVLINAEQFSVLVRSQAIGDTVTLHGLRDGEPIKLKAKLGEADVPPLGPGGRDLDQAWRLQLNQAQPPAGLRRIKMLDDPAMPEQARDMIKKLEQQMFQQRQEMDKRMQQLREQLNLDIDQLRGRIAIPQGNGDVQKQMQATMMWSDGKYKIHISSDNGKSHLTITDHADKVLYDGALPKDGLQDVPKDVPKDVQQKVDQLLNNMRIKHRIVPQEQQKQPGLQESPLRT